MEFKNINELKSGIYGLFDSSNQKFFYVGQAINIKKRCQSHYRDALRKYQRSIKNNFMECVTIESDKKSCFAFILLNGWNVSVVVLEECRSKKELDYYESLWCSLLSKDEPISNGCQVSTRLYCPVSKNLIKKSNDFYSKGLNFIIKNQCGPKRGIVINEDIAGLRRLRKDRKDLHEKVLDNDMTVNEAMIAAGFRKKMISMPKGQDVQRWIDVIIRDFSEEDRLAISNGV